MMAFGDEGHNIASDAHEHPEEDESDDNDPYDAACELRLVPADESSLSAMFAALSDGAALNPDPMDDQEDAGDFIFNEEEVCLCANWIELLFDAMLTRDDCGQVAQGALSDAQQRALERWDELLVAGQDGVDGQFDDAEYDEEEAEDEGNEAYEDAPQEGEKPPQ